MASAMRKMAVYLGLVEDDQRFDDQYADEYDDGYDDGYDEYGAELVQDDDRQDSRLPDAPAGGRPGDRRPAEKSTRRLASLSTISVKFMITGVPSRKCSPIVRASLYVRGCKVVILAKSVVCT